MMVAVHQHPARDGHQEVALTPASEFEHAFPGLHAFEDLPGPHSRAFIALVQQRCTVGRRGGRRGRMAAAVRDTNVLQRAKGRLPHCSAGRVLSASVRSCLWAGEPVVKTRFSGHAGVAEHAERDPHAWDGCLLYTYDAADEKR